MANRREMGIEKFKNLPKRKRKKLKNHFRK
jgi:hypothetical protein